jgi:HlyD family secretion protein
MKKRILIISLIIVIGIAVFFIVSLKKQKDDGTMLLSGNIEVTETNVSFKIPGRIVERLVDEGDRIKPGDVIARLDSAELSAVVAQNRAALKEAATRLTELRAGSRPQEIGQARANVRAQEADLEKVRKDFERAEVLFKNGAISATQFDASRSAYESRAAQVRSAGETLSLVREGPRKEDIEMAAHRVDQATAAVAAAEQRLKDTVIYSPTEGIVLRKNVEPGETIAAGTPVVTVGDLAQPWVKVYVKEDKMGLLKLGQKATITVDTYKDKTYEGVVSYISSEAEFTPKTVQTPEERVKLVFAVKVRVKNEKGELKPSMPADVRLAIRP